MIPEPHYKVCWVDPDPLTSWTRERKIILQVGFAPDDRRTVLQRAILLDKHLHVQGVQEDGLTIRALNRKTSR